MSFCPVLGLRCGCRFPELRWTSFAPKPRISNPRGATTPGSESLCSAPAAWAAAGDCAVAAATTCVVKIKYIPSPMTRDSPGDYGQDFLEELQSRFSWTYPSGPDPLRTPPPQTWFGPYSDLISTRFGPHKGDFRSNRVRISGRNRVGIGSGGEVFRGASGPEGWVQLKWLCSSSQSVWAIAPGTLSPSLHTQTFAKRYRS